VTPWPQLGQASSRGSSSPHTSPRPAHGLASDVPKIGCSRSLRRSSRGCARGSTPCGTPDSSKRSSRRTSACSCRATWSRPPSEAKEMFVSGSGEPCSTAPAGPCAS
jgi:hypothetical protein